MPEDYGKAHLQELLQPLSAYGKKALRDLRPMESRAALEKRLERIEAAIALRLLTRETRLIEHILAQMRDISGSMTACHSGSSLTDVELFEIKRHALQLEELRGLREALPEIEIAEFPEVLTLLDPGGQRGQAFHVADSYSEKLAALRREKTALEARWRQNPGDEALTAARRDLIERESWEEEAICARLSEALRPYMAALLENAALVAELDLVLAAARLAVAQNCCRPVLAEDLRLRGGWHPGLGIADFSPVEVDIGPGLTVITGANMGGKSVALKTVAFNAWMVQCGLFPFAREMRCPLFDTLHFLSGDQAEGSLSSFGGEIVGLTQALSEAEGGSALFLLDEFARSTNPEEGGALARGLAAYMREKPFFTLMATHYDGVAKLAGAHYQVKGLSALWEDERLPEDIAGRLAYIGRQMDYGLLPAKDGEVPREALRVARLLGLPEEILQKAEKNLK